uniref:Uncharacterized protein n=1 Tax=Rhizophora mucronata TaxID=61149 RepID=A0A2P2MZ76_RHIMU
MKPPHLVPRVNTPWIFSHCDLLARFLELS